MMSIRLRWVKTARSLGIVAVLVAVTGCNRKPGEPMPQDVSRPEAPLATSVSPARPENVTTPGTTPNVGDPLGNPAPGTSGAPSELSSGDHREAKGKFKTATGYKLSGSAKFEEIATGVRVLVDVEDAPAGLKGIHIHEKGDCSDIPGKSMGEHFAPGAKQHGVPPSQAHHLGDLGNIQIDKGGKAHFEFVVSNANLKKNDPMSFLGRSIVIHEGQDKGTQPSGGSGKPIACAVIEAD